MPETAVVYLFSSPVPGRCECNVTHESGHISGIQVFPSYSNFRKSGEISAFFFPAMAK